MNELKPEDVMRALGICNAVEYNCEGCPYFGTTTAKEGCSQFLMRDALALLRENDAEIERLSVNMNAYGLTAKNLAKDFADYQADVKMEIADARAEAITEFALRLKSCEFYEVADQYDGMQYVDFCDWVDQIAEKLKGETDGETDL